MGWKDPEQAREYQRRYHEANAEKKREAARRWQAANPERVRENTRRWNAANAEKIRERSRTYYAANRDELLAKNRENYAANREQYLQAARESYRAGRRDRKKRRRNALVAELWHEQGGACYLCGKPLRLEESHLDHDHRCCPALSFCDFCVRGAAHPNCNNAIGHAEDDPDRLELIARNLRAKLAEVDERLAGKPEQLPLGGAP